MGPFELGDDFVANGIVGGEGGVGGGAKTAPFFCV